MNLAILKQINWVDIFILILLLRISYTALRNGIFVELFKFLGVLAGIYLSLHYYTSLANFLDRFIKTKTFAIEIFDFASLVILIAVGYLIFISIRESLLRLIKVEVVSGLNKWVAGVLGVIRGILVASLIVYVFSLPVISYFKESVKKSYSGEKLITLSPTVYTRIWDGFMSKFMPHEDFNKAVLEVQKSK